MLSEVSEFLNHPLVTAGSNCVGIVLILVYCIIWLLMPRAVKMRFVFARYWIYLVLELIALLLISTNDVLRFVASKVDSSWFTPAFINAWLPFMAFATAFSYSQLMSGLLTGVRLMMLVNALRSGNARTRLRSARWARVPRFVHFAWEWVVIALVGVVNIGSREVPDMLNWISSTRFADIVTWASMFRVTEQVVFFVGQLICLAFVFSLAFVARERRIAVLYVVLLFSLFTPYVARSVVMALYLFSFVVQKATGTELFQSSMSLLFGVSSHMFVGQLAIMAIIFVMYILFVLFTSHLPEKRAIRRANQGYPTDTV
ncbi:hypothetical protein J8273_6066 [Carpediemonas membranifera]|uniref:Uncharacterized protein n=1 Tax=Carpediemonas membranifera TaxID=201153 RepID=A0A8J6B022_9EUKA|nr:hypothetical protein J8273_6066 [Carpediemonas membranifera]|eukprot:KAG9392598.1 hypothetical protein J8273_6066 [Carpediemonas membranifera]